MPKSASKIRRRGLVSVNRNIGGFDVAMQQPAQMGVVERVGDSRNDLDDLRFRHSGRALSAE
jgi:hypothetical protein